VFFLCRGQFRTAIFVRCVIFAPICAMTVVGITM